LIAEIHPLDTALVESGWGRANHRAARPSCNPPHPQHPCNPPALPSMSPASPKLASSPCVNNCRGVKRWCQWVQPRSRIGFFGFVPSFRDRFRRDEALALPVDEAFPEQLERTLSSRARSASLRRSVAADLLGLAVLHHRLHPADAVEPLLKDIAGARHDVVIGPAAQSFRAAQRFHRPRTLGSKGIDDTAIDDRCTFPSL
jgi:hypothetical protein